MSRHELRCPECGYAGEDSDASRARRTVEWHNERAHGGEAVAEVAEVTVCAHCRQPLGDNEGTRSRRGEPVHRSCLAEVEG
jgi:hypothetical protein